MCGSNPTSSLKLSSAIKVISSLTTTQPSWAKKRCGRCVSGRRWTRRERCRRISLAQPWDQPGTHTASPLPASIHILARTGIFFSSGMTDLSRVDSPAPLNLPLTHPFLSWKRKVLNSREFTSWVLRNAGPNHPGRGEWNLLQKTISALMLRAKDKVRAEGTCSGVFEVEGNPAIRLRRGRMWDTRFQSLSGLP